nr:hypothetical protein GCM10020092_087430 [Actinoplanes digitatis]
MPRTLGRGATIMGADPAPAGPGRSGCTGGHTVGWPQDLSSTPEEAAECRGVGGTRASTGSRWLSPAESFSSQADAESWIGQAWRELAAAGVTQVTLVEDDRVDYQMSLLPTE